MFIFFCITFFSLFFAMSLCYLSEADCVRIVTLLKENNNQRYVANCFGISQSVASRIFSQFWETGSYHRRSDQGCLRETSNRNDRAIVQQAVQNRLYLHVLPLTILIMIDDVRSRLHDKKSFKKSRITRSSTSAGSIPYMPSSSPAIKLCLFFDQQATKTM